LSKLTITNTVTGKTLVLRNDKADRFVNLSVGRIDKRQTIFRLTKQQRDALDVALPDDLPDPLVEKIENALARYRIHKSTRTVYDQRSMRRSQLKRLKAARSLQSLLGVHALGPLEQQLQRFINELNKSVALLKHDGRHRPIDEDRLELGLSTAWALDDVGVPLSAGRSDASVLVLVLQLVLQWADELDSRPPRARRNLYRFALIVMRRYKPWRKQIEARILAYERWWENRDRRQRLQNSSRRRAVK